MRAVLLFAVTMLACSIAWGNGEPIRYDPTTGVILPGGPTTARVESEELTVDFVPREDHQEYISHVNIQATYRITNPTSAALDLKIGFPIPGGGDCTEPPVRLDGQPMDWRLLSYEELLKPLKPELVRAMRSWAKDHPRAMALAEEMRSIEPRGDQAQRERLKELWRQLRGELPGVDRDTRYWESALAALRPEVGADTATDASLWTLESAIRLTGQGHLLPGGRWHVGNATLDASTGREVRETRNHGDRSVSLLVFPLHLKPQATQELTVRYRQMSGLDEGGDPYLRARFVYVLETETGWASFGPIAVAVRAPSGLVCRTLPRLRDAGTSNGLTTYRAKLRDPRRNLQIALATREVLLPRLKHNGHLGGRYDMLVGGDPVLPRHALPAGVEARMVQGEIVFRRRDVTVRVRPGEKQMIVLGKAEPLSTPVVVRKGVSYLPVEVIQALFPESNVTLTYHAPSNTVLFSLKPPPL